MRRLKKYLKTVVLVSFFLISLTSVSYGVHTTASKVEHIFIKCPEHFTYSQDFVVLSLYAEELKKVRKEKVRREIAARKETYITIHEKDLVQKENLQVVRWASDFQDREEMRKRQALESTEKEIARRGRHQVEPTREVITGLEIARQAKLEEEVVKEVKAKEVTKEESTRNHISFSQQEEKVHHKKPTSQSRSTFIQGTDQGQVYKYVQKIAKKVSVFVVQEVQTKGIKTHGSLEKQRKAIIRKATLF